MKFWKQRKRNFFGVTLTELLIVITIIGLAAGYAFYNFSGASERNLQKQTRKTLQSMLSGAVTHDLQKPSGLTGVELNTAWYQNWKSNLRNYAVLPAENPQGNPGVIPDTLAHVTGQGRNQVTYFFDNTGGVKRICAQYAFNGGIDCILWDGEFEFDDPIPPSPGCIFNAQCDDGNICNGVESCDFTPPPPNSCVNGTALNCDDFNACTTDTCDSITGCAHAPVVCDDSSVCTIDTCAPGGSCIFTPIPGCCTGPGDCDDADACTSDVCSSNVCEHNTITPCCGNGTTEGPETCDDGNTVDGDGCSSTCQSEAICGDGVLDPGGSEECEAPLDCANAYGPPPNNTLWSCDASTSCLCDLTCPAGYWMDWATLTCITNCTSNAQCNDGNVCTQDTCFFAMSNPCPPGTPVGVICGACLNSPRTWQAPPSPNSVWTCNLDANACTQDRCVAGTCTAGPPVVCSGGPMQCHIGPTCSPADGSCNYITAPQNSPCDDGNACTINDRCNRFGGCLINDPLNCDNGLYCDGAETCDPILACQPSTNPCPIIDPLEPICIEPLADHCKQCIDNSFDIGVSPQCQDLANSNLIDDMALYCFSIGPVEAGLGPLEHTCVECIFSGHCGWKTADCVAANPGDCASCDSVTGECICSPAAMGNCA